MSEAEDSFATEGIAVIGMAGRFPRARDLAEFWENLRAGIPALSTFSDEELRAAGVPPELLANPRYVKARGRLEDTDLFDAAFFDYSPREAEQTDPQHRLLLECAWEALEDAGYDSQRYGGRIGVFAGASMSTYMLEALRGNGMPENLLQLAIGGLSDFLATRISYKLNLRGPSVTVQTACSTSLVAIHMACQSLLADECDMALAGGVSAALPQEVAGYLYQEGGIFSPDGHCRAFDAEAQGTVVGSGVGVVVLKRLEDALADGDHIRAVIRGIGDQQRRLAQGGLHRAQRRGAGRGRSPWRTTMAGVEPGDDRLRRGARHRDGAGRSDRDRRADARPSARTTEATGFCAIGSVKTNIGHLDAAAGVAGLIKTVLVLQHGSSRPACTSSGRTRGSTSPAAPVYVNARLRRLARARRRPAGPASARSASAAPTPTWCWRRRPSEPSSAGRGAQVLVLSARTPTALARATDRLARTWRSTRSCPWPTWPTRCSWAAGPSRTGARWCAARARRRWARSRACAPERVLEGESRPSRAWPSCSPARARSTWTWAASCTRASRCSASSSTHCARLLKPHLGVDLRQVLYPPEAQREQAEARLAQTGLTQPALFAVEYALAQQWEAWGVRPRAMLGHSVGEYVAACLAGVFSLEDALAVVAARGRLMQRLPPGAMLASRCPRRSCEDCSASGSPWPPSMVPR